MTEYVAFTNELEKLAFGEGFVRNLKTVGSRLIPFGGGLSAGWKAMSPTAVITAGGKRGADLVNRINKAKAGGAIARTFGPGEHLLQNAAQTGGVRGAAEELSRRGWTGASKATKYLPFGDKGQLMVLGPMASAPALLHSLRHPDAERGFGEEGLGTLGITGSAILTAGTGVPGIITDLAAGNLGAALGRRLDRLGAGRRPHPQGAPT